jgi:hypothetical protein
MSAREAVMPKITRLGRVLVPGGASAEETLRAGIAAFLDFVAREPAFARAFYVDMPAAGPRPRGATPGGSA